MQGQRNSMGSLPDTISFDLNPAATDTNIDQPIFWSNNIQNYAQSMVPEYITPNTTNNSTYLNPSNQAQNLSGWNMGESSSSVAQSYATLNEQKLDDVPINAMNLNQTNSHIPFSPLFMQSSSNNAYRQGLDLGVEVGENSGNNHQLMEENVCAPSNGGYFGEEICSSEGRRLSRKRKAIEGHIGQSSSSGSPNFFQPRESNDWNNVPGWYNTHLGSNTSLENPIANGEIPVNLNITPNIETTRRNHRVRINLSPQQSPSPSLVSNGTVSGDSNVLTYPQSSRLLPLGTFSGTRTPQPRRYTRGSSSRTAYPLSFGERIARPNEVAESNTSQRTVLENSLIAPNGNLSIDGNAGRSAHPIPNPSALSQRTHPLYTRRLSDIRRSLLSPPLPETGGQNGDLPLQGGSSSLQTAPGHGARTNTGDRLLRLRSALRERQLDSASGGTNSLRNATGGPEGRSRLVSEIRNILDLMRRGEGLRMEDMILLDQSGFFAMADIHDRHRDMRLDVDNMSYEELLALGEQIGNVNTGLSEETILNCLKQRKFFSIAMGAQSELEPCCICREEYNDGEDIGTVECGHEFHSGCIKQWLMLKNSCPICKLTALNK